MNDAGVKRLFSDRFQYKNSFPNLQPTKVPVLSRAADFVFRNHSQLIAGNTSRLFGKGVSLLMIRRPSCGSAVDSTPIALVQKLTTQAEVAPSLAQPYTYLCQRIDHPGRWLFTTILSAISIFHELSQKIRETVNQNGFPCAPHE